MTLLEQSLPSFIRNTQAELHQQGYVILPHIFSDQTCHLRILQRLPNQNLEPDDY